MRVPVGVAAILAAGTAGAYTTLVPQRIWPAYTVVVELDSGRAEGSIADADHGQTAIVDALNDAVDGWNGTVPGLVSASVQPNRFVIGDGISTVTFSDPTGTCTGPCLAATLTGYYTGMGVPYQIEDADIFVTKRKSTKFTSELEDPTIASCAGEYYLDGTLTHEVGHVIGLGHSAVAGSTMSAFAAACDLTADELDADDESGALFLYP